MTNVQLFRCAVCGKDKPYEQMRKEKRNASGVARECNDCRSTMRAGNGEYMRERIRKYEKRKGGKAAMINFAEMAELLGRKNCAYCGCTLTLDSGSPAEMTIDHVYSLSDSYGSENIALNLATSCRSCNSKKASDHVYDFYRRSDAFTAELWHAFCADFTRKMYDREPTAVEVEAIKRGFAEEAAELAAAKGVPV